ncbi:hypothetical protein JCM16358_13440 [Halanaerocella petrolearia]
MQKLVKLGLLGLVILALLAGCAQQETKPKIKTEVKMKELKVAVVSQDKIWTESEKAQQYQKKLNQQIEKLQQDYQQEAKDLSQEEKADRRQEVYNNINKLREDLRGEFRDKIINIVEEIVEQKNYDVVLNKQEVKYGGTDITDKVIEKLDKSE